MSTHEVDIQMTVTIDAETVDKAETELIEFLFLLDTDLRIKAEVTARRQPTT